MDIETARQDRTVLKEVGVFRPDSGTRARLSGSARNFVGRLNDLTEGASFVLGHNVKAFDQPALAVLHPDLALHRLPLVDTLELSPIAFPQNPYHRLVKDYKLCTTTRNDPVRDAELAYELFLQQADALRGRVDEHPAEMLCLHYLLAPDAGDGLAGFFSSLRGTSKPGLSEVQAAWMEATDGKVCARAQRIASENWLVDPQWHKPLAYTLAWLRVAGGNSVLPPWVLSSYPRTREAIDALRDEPCSDAGCAWCSKQHDLMTLLPRYFPGITRFRSTPATPEGRPLQQSIVEHVFSKRPTLAILPTGGGKSLCFQLPALARFYRNGSLTVVVSPLQSLMKDQVDNLEKRGITCAGYLNSLLNPIERRAMLDKLRLGDLGLIFVAPEQFRSMAFASALRHRSVGAWVFDEAHCLSKWGHDFRPDYLYVSRFIRTRQHDKPSPIFCFTATAKPDVIEDIRLHFSKQLGVSLEILAGGVRRDNLVYEVREVPTQAKYPEVLRLLQNALREEGGAIVFCARQKTVEELATFLQEAGISCSFFHGGMLPGAKRDTQQAFLSGQLRVIAATNAFGMGVDKPDVRLVIHLDTPGSLENYLQEAGRAGRDQEVARCILLFDEADLDVQFRFLRNARLTQYDIHSILKALRQIERKDRGDGSVVVTSGEILLEIPEKLRIDPEASDADTKVRIAIAWLEEARLLERHENHTRVFPGSLLVGSIEEAEALLRRKLGENTEIDPYLKILSLLLQAGDDESVSTDELMLSAGTDSRTLQAMLRDLDRLKLLSNDTEIGVTFYREPDTAERLQSLCRLEEALVASLRESAPDADQESWQALNVRRLCDTLRRDAAVDFDPEKLSRLLRSFGESFGDGSAKRGLFAIRPGGIDTRYVKLLRSWQQIDDIRRRRFVLASALVGEFARRRQGNNLLVTCRQGELESALQGDVTVQGLEIQDWGAALGASLIYLDANEVLHLARGKAVFRSAMTIALNAEARRRKFNKSDYAELDLHYKDKIVQVHVMSEYARLALRKLRAAVEFIDDYFGLPRDAFIRRYFTGRKEVLDIATTEASHRRILTDLNDPEQQAIVAAPLEGSHLVLAGPGSGKTRVIVHRVAWLLRESMVLPESIMVLTYNGSAAAEIRRRLWALVGADAGGVVVQTLHGLAMRLTGTSYAVAGERGETIDFSDVLKTAAARLRRAEGTDGTELSLERERVLSGLQWLLVDEYQDINGDHYELISALAGRTLASAEDRLSLMVVGDDDQNIYSFDGANVRYIRQYEADYRASRFHLLENYRSTKNILECANAVIRRARNRMKADHVIRVNNARRLESAGGEYQALDPVAGGRVHILEVPSDRNRAAQAAFSELQRLERLSTEAGGGRAGQWGRFAVMARRWEDLEAMAALCRLRGVPIRVLREGDDLKLHATREGQHLLSLLRRQKSRGRRTRVVLRFGALSRWFRRRYRVAVDELMEHPQRILLAQFIMEAEAVGLGGDHVVQDLIEAIYEFESRAGSGQSARANGPMVLMTAHRAKGQEFDHVLILDEGGWSASGDDERRLFYVAMTRARKTLTICESDRQTKHPFLGDFADLALRTKPGERSPDPRLDYRTFRATPRDVVLSWPGYFRAGEPVHRALAELDVGDPLELRPRQGAGAQWELADVKGVAVTRMASRFQPPKGRIVQVRVAAVLARKKQGDEFGTLRCDSWELVLPEIQFEPGGAE